MRYTLPFFLETEVRLDHNGHVRFEVGSEHQLTDRLEAHWWWNSDKEWRVGAHYAFNKMWSAVATYDSEENAGVGIGFSF